MFKRPASGIVTYPLALLQNRMVRDVTYKMLRIVSRVALVPLFLQAKACSAIVFEKKTSPILLFLLIILHKKFVVRKFIILIPLSSTSSHPFTLTLFRYKCLHTDFTVHIELR